jgi:uncharacterized protein DUF4340
VSWRRVATIYVVLALLAGYVLVFERAPPPPAPVEAPNGPSLLEADATSVTAVTFRKQGRVVRAAVQDQRWRTVEPAGAKVPSDLIEATIATLTAGQAAERLDNEPEHALAAYGLDAPSASVEVVVGGPAARSFTVFVGARNPTRTAVYARRSDQPSIYLVGMNLSYYIDLIFEAADA